MANGFSTFKGNHQYITGVALVTIGLVGFVGSITGRLADMMAALFVPSALYNSGNGSPAPQKTVTGGGFSIGSSGNNAGLDIKLPSWL